MSCPASYHGLPDWISEVWRFPDLISEFDMSPIHPSEVKRVLKNCSSSSAPGPFEETSQLSQLSGYSVLQDSFTISFCSCIMVSRQNHITV